MYSMNFPWQLFSEKIYSVPFPYVVHTVIAIVSGGFFCLVFCGVCVAGLKSQGEETLGH